MATGQYAIQTLKTANDASGGHGRARSATAWRPTCCTTRCAPTCTRRCSRPTTASCRRRPRTRSRTPRTCGRPSRTRARSSTGTQISMLGQALSQVDSYASSAISLVDIAARDRATALAQRGSFQSAFEELRTTLDTLNDEILARLRRRGLQRARRGLQGAGAVDPAERRRDRRRVRRGATGRPGHREPARAGRGRSRPTRRRRPHGPRRGQGRGRGRAARHVVQHGGRRPLRSGPDAPRVGDHPGVQLRGAVGHEHPDGRLGRGDLGPGQRRLGGRRAGERQREHRGGQRRGDVGLDPRDRRQRQRGRGRREPRRHHRRERDHDRVEARRELGARSARSSR